MSTQAFEGTTIPDRPAKPRQAGLTMLIDWGLAGAAQADWLEIGAPYINLAKIAVGISRLLPADLLRKKIQLYRQHQVIPFPGGQFLEYAVYHGQASDYLAAARTAGYGWIEVGVRSSDFNRFRPIWMTEVLSTSRSANVQCGEGDTET